MNLTNRAAAAALAGLNECFAEVEEVAPWRWQCTTRDESRLPISVLFSDGFIRLVVAPDMMPGVGQAIDRALSINASLVGGVISAIGPGVEQLKFYTDIAVVTEPQVRARLAWAARGFRSAADGFTFDIQNRQAGEAASPSEFSELLRKTSWDFAECAIGEWSIALDAEAAPPAKVRIRESGIFATVELVRVNATAMTTGQALALFLLTAGWTLRFVRIRASDLEMQRAFAFEVGLPLAPAPEELDHALASLSVAHRICAREANFLLDEVAARCYLASRTPSFTCEPLNEKEI